MEAHKPELGLPNQGSICRLLPGMTYGVDKSHTGDKVGQPEKQ